VADHSDDFVILACVILTQYSSVTDGRTDEQTDAQAMAKTRSILLWRVKTVADRYKHAAYHNKHWWQTF